MSAVGVQDAQSIEPSDDAGLLHRFKAGDATAFAEIFERYAGQIYRIGYRRMEDPHDAADVTQETFLRAYRALAKLPDDANLGGWLYRVAVNVCLDAQRRRQRITYRPWDASRHGHLLTGSQLDDPVASLSIGETRAQVRETLARLDRRHRLVLVLREYQGRSWDEIGNLMQLTPAGAKSLAFRARIHFRKMYQSVAAEPAATRR